MKYTHFHQHKISQITLGTIQLGMDYGIANTQGAPDQETAFGILDTARHSGICTFDCARIYGRAEDVLGAYVAENPSSEDLVITKFKYDWTPGTTLEEAWQKTKASVQASLESLRTDHIPLILYHKGPEEPIGTALEMVPVLISRLKEEGMIGHGGISLYYPEEARHMNGESTLEAIQIPLNILDQAVLHDGTLKTLHQNGKLIFIRSVFLQGLFFREPDSLSGNLVAAAPYLKRIQTLANEYGCSIAELTFGFIRDLPEADSLVIGAESREQVLSGLALLEAPRLPDSLKSELAALAKNVPKEVITPGLWN